MAMTHRKVEVRRSVDVGGLPFTSSAVCARVVLVRRGAPRVRMLGTLTTPVDVRDTCDSSRVEACTLLHQDVRRERLTSSRAPQCWPWGRTDVRDDTHQSAAAALPRVMARSALRVMAVSPMPTCGPARHDDARVVGATDSPNAHAWARRLRDAIDAITTRWAHPSVAHLIEHCV